MVIVMRRCTRSDWLARVLRERAQRILRVLRLSHGELSLVLVNDAQIRVLNRTHRKIDRPTDVLSFPMHGRQRPARGALLLGDVVISVDTARRQARAERLPISAVGERLLIHGVLHLLGYDHEVSEAEAHRMARRERSLAAAIRANGAQRRR
jgi:probable rRNA maturation factor